ncbi:MAG: UDP-N-acetylmuramoyl-tripeptide--D-alanyl-D-alanine ligase [Bacilli bacterium]|nr:UDP-N-acetylmuramoyl-tripeptide--D-alanyl-D-alanine ligase [Bacilli bacterium]
MKLNISNLSNIINGEIYGPVLDINIHSFSKDTRTINNGDVYIGIKGENFDGNTLYNEAFEKGAILCILEKASFDYKEVDKPIILVDSSLEALKNIGEYYRNNSNATFIAVTGSVGKTSTRDMIYSVVSKKDKSLKTLGNFNNNIGLPLTLTRLTDEKFAVIEMGMNNLGEIDYLSKITKPHIAVITNVTTAHIGNLGSRENILKAKLEIKNGLVEGGKLIINNDNDMLHNYYLENKENTITIGIENPSDIMASNLEIKDSKYYFDITYQDNIYHANVPILSVAFIYNSLIAFAVGVLTNIEVEKILDGISSFELTENRIDFVDSDKGYKIINGCYNASVDSMKSSLEILKNTKGNKKIAVLGNMLELDNYSKELHEEVGTYTNGLDILITVGSDAKYIAKTSSSKEIYSFDNNEDAINKLKEILEKDDVVLIKASNGMKFINIFNEIK